MFIRMVMVILIIMESENVENHIDFHMNILMDQFQKD